MLDSIGFFVDERGNKPVEEFILGLAVKEQTKMVAYLTQLKIQGHNLRRPMADYLGEGIYELRPKHNRVFYFFYLRNQAVLLHAIRKKTDKILNNDFELCVKRKIEVEVLKNIEKVNL